MERFEGVNLEILEGMVELCKSEISTKILESLARSLDASYRDLFEKPAQKYGKALYYDELIKSIDILERFGLLKIEFESPPRVRITQRGMVTLRAHKLAKKALYENLVSPISKELNLKDDKYDELVSDVNHFYIEILEETKDSSK